MPRSKSTEEMTTIRRTKVEQLLATNMSVREWCALNHIKPATMYDWLAYFRDNDPDVFGGYENAHAGDGKSCWVVHVRRAMRESRAIQLAPAVPQGAAADKVPASFAVVDTASLREPAPQPSPQPASQPAPCCFTVRARGVEVEVPLAAGEAALASAIRAVASL